MIIVDRQSLFLCIYCRQEVFVLMLPLFTGSRCSYNYVVIVNRKSLLKCGHYKQVFNMIFKTSGLFL